MNRPSDPAASRRPRVRRWTRVVAGLALAIGMLGGSAPAGPMVQKDVVDLTKKNLAAAMALITAKGIPEANIRLFQNDPFVEIAMPPAAQQVDFEVLFTIPEPNSVIADTGLLGVVVMPPDSGGGVEPDPEPGPDPLIVIIIVVQVVTVIVLAWMFRKVSSS